MKELLNLNESVAKILTENNVEQIDEISKKTIGSYVSKASTDIKHAAMLHAKLSPDNTSMLHAQSSSKKHRDKAQKDMSDEQKYYANTVRKRSDALQRAARKISEDSLNEEYENDTEMHRDQHNYNIESAKDAYKKYMHHKTNADLTKNDVEKSHHKVIASKYADLMSHHESLASHHRQAHNKLESNIKYHI